MVLFTNIAYDGKVIRAHGEDMDRKTSADVVISLISDDLKVSNAKSTDSKADSIVETIGIKSSSWNLRMRLERKHKLKSEEAIAWG